MNLCDKHHAVLCQKVKAAGLTDFLVDDEKIPITLSKHPQEMKPDEFDPIIQSAILIYKNGIDQIMSIAPDRAMKMLTVENLNDPVDGTNEELCPICVLNALAKEHDDQCFDPTCKVPRGMTFDGWINNAVEGCKRHIKMLMKKGQ